MPDRGFCFVHAADLHLDSPFSGIGRLAPEIGARLRDASLEAFDALVDLAIGRGAAFVVLAGDLYDAADRGVRAQLRFLRGVERLGERGVPVFVAHGNHDPLNGWSAVRRAPENLTVFGAGEVEARAVSLGGEPVAQVYGISYARRDTFDNLAARFRRIDAPGIHIGVLHCNAGSQPEHAPYSPCAVADLAASGMDYWALGHIHRHQVLCERPWIVYPGCLQASKANELGPRGAVVVEAAGAAVRRVEFVALDQVRFAEIEIDIAEEADLHGLRKAILARAGPGPRDTILTVALTGRGPLHRDLRRPEALADLARDVRDELGIASPFVWINRILDRTRPELDLEAIAGRGDFSSDLMRLVHDLRANPEKPAEEMALPVRVDPEGAVDFESLLREAEERALDLLESEQQR
jgi:exonuclease SbcD